MHSQRTEIGSRQFTIDTCLGKGGFGEVYLASMRTQGGLSKTVALKVLRADLDPESQAVERLRDEGKLLAEMGHPNILGVHDVTLIEGRVALVAEYVEGQDLDLCFKGDPPLGPRALLQAIGEVAGALAAAWSKLDLVHRDIKPSNIRIGTHGQVKLLDFGIARSDTTAREAKTATNMLVGSLPYMAPERFLDPSPNPAADVFALGCCLFEGLTGQRLYVDVTPPFMAGLAISGDRHVQFLEERLALLPDSLGEEYRNVLVDCLDHDPSRRPPAADLAGRCEALADDTSGPSLKSWARSRTWPTPAQSHEGLVGRTLSDGTLARPTPQPPPSTGEQPTGSFSRTSTVAAVGAGSVVLLGGGALLFTVLVGGGLWAGGVFGSGESATPGDDRSIADVAPDDEVGAGEVDANDVPDDDGAREGDGAGVTDADAVDAAASTGEATAAAATTPAQEPDATEADDEPGTGEAASDTPAEPEVTETAAAPPPPPTKPAAKPMSTYARIGNIPALLQGGGQNYTPGPLPAGEYFIIADLGAGADTFGAVTCPADGTCTVRCNPLLGSCSGESSK